MTFDTWLEYNYCLLRYHRIHPSPEKLNDKTFYLYLAILKDIKEKEKKTGDQWDINNQ